jgi:hypothetical protein
MDDNAAGQEHKSSNHEKCMSRLLAIGHIASGHRLRMDEGNRAGGGDQGKQENGSEKLGHSCPPLAIGRISVGGLQMHRYRNANVSVMIRAIRSLRIQFEVPDFSDPQAWDL